jgi:membrane protease YdiL (CAAX protease family)
MAALLRSYFRETRQPIYSAVLLLPFFLVYHIGALLLRTTFINGADALIIRMLGALSVHSMFASAIVLLICFIVWQLRTRAKWQVDSRRLLLMYMESFAYALLLFLFFGWLPVGLSRTLPKAGQLGGIEKLVLYCGAGIYEELVFRGFLLGLLLFLSARLIRSKTLAAVVASIFAALLFSMFHYVGPTGDPFTLVSFMQRTLGGLYFSILFVTRGFGVTASAHALYDMIVGLTIL